MNLNRTGLSTKVTLRGHQQLIQEVTKNHQQQFKHKPHGPQFESELNT